MKLVILGAPGSGKGTQAQKLAKKLSILHISTGDIFRDNMERKTILGMKVKKIIDAGNLASDELTDALIKDRLVESDCKNGFILDGYPRNVHQCEVLDSIILLDAVINLRVPDEDVINRLSARRTCSVCKKVYNLDFKPPKVKGKCKCGGALVMRKDDDQAGIAKRLSLYHKNAQLIINYYKKAGILIDIDGAVGMKNVLAEILEKLEVNE